MSPPIHFLIDASLPRAVSQVIQTAGYQATDVRDIGLGTASDAVIAAHAKRHHLSLISRDGDFGNILDYPPADYHGIVVVQTPEVAPKALVLGIIERFLRDALTLEHLTGRLAVVDLSHIRLRPGLPPSLDEHGK
jgi:predicted nuclease of predicted toxin-antitoxin system